MGTVAARARIRRLAAVAATVTTVGTGFVVHSTTRVGATTASVDVGGTYTGSDTFDPQNCSVAGSLVRFRSTGTLQTLGASSIAYDYCLEDASAITGTFSITSAAGSVSGTLAGSYGDFDQNTSRYPDVFTLTATAGTGATNGASGSVNDVGSVDQDGTNIEGTITGSFTMTLPDPQPQVISFAQPAPAVDAVGHTYAVLAHATSGLTVSVSVDPASASVCALGPELTVFFNATGLCTIHADQAGDADWQAAPTATVDIQIVAQPTFTASSPDLRTVYGASYSYDFDATESGAPNAPVRTGASALRTPATSSITYSLASGAPAWLHIDPSTGVVSGTVPTVTGFTYSVVASNVAGDTTAGPFKIVVGWPTVLAGPLATTSGSALGYSIANTGNAWKVFVTHPGRAKVTFDATISFNPGTIGNLKLIRGEPGDTYTIVSGRTLKFHFVNYGFLDGLSFTGPANATSVRFTLAINGAPATAAQILLGATATPATSGSPVTFLR